MKKVIVITGGSQGFGKVLARRLAAANTVIIMAPDRKELAAAAKEISCEYVVGDVSDSGSVARAFKGILKKYKKIDCLVNNAGIWIEGPLEKSDPKRIEQAMAINSNGTILCSQAVIPSMKKRKSGTIINVISQAGFYARPNRTVYQAAKWGMTGFTKSLALDLEPLGIRVTGLYPGKMKTSLFKNAGMKKDMSDALDPDDVAKVVEFIFEFPGHVVFPEIGIKYIGQ